MNSFHLLVFIDVSTDSVSLLSISSGASKEFSLFDFMLPRVELFIYHARFLPPCSGRSRSRICGGLVMLIIIKHFTYNCCSQDAHNIKPFY